MASDSTASILTLVNQTLELPTLPEVLVRLNDVMADPDVSVDRVAQVVAADPAVSANVLRLVNSAYYGLQVRVSTVQLAISIMGFSMIRRVALKAAVLNEFGKKGRDVEGFDARFFWRHSIFAGVAGRALTRAAEDLVDVDPEDGYMAGLLHDIGKLILADHVGSRYAEFVGRARRGEGPLRRLEMEELGFDHADVGSVLAIKWLLPEEIAVSIRYHHAPLEDPFHRRLSCAIHLADHLAISSGYPSVPNVAAEGLEVGVYDELAIPPEAVEGLLETVQDEFAAVEMPW